MKSLHPKCDSKPTSTPPPPTHTQTIPPLTNPRRKVLTIRSLTDVQLHLGPIPSVSVVCPKYIATIKMIYFYSCTHFHFHFHLLTLPFILSESAIQCASLLLPKKAMDMNVLLVTSLTSKCVVNYTCRKASSD